MRGNGVLHDYHYTAKLRLCQKLIGQNMNVFKAYFLLSVIFIGTFALVVMICLLK